MKTSVILLAVLCVGVVYGQTVPRLEPPVVEGTVGQNVSILCIVTDSDVGSTELLTDGNSQLDTLGRDLQSDRVVFYYGPLVAEDDGRLLICQYGMGTSEGNISVLFPAVYALDETVRNVPEGNQYTVNVNVTANPIPTNEETTWTFDGNANLGTGVTVTYNSISFESVARAHTGVYAVTSTTVAGTSETFEITVNALYQPMFGAGFGEGIRCNDGSSPYVCAVEVGDSGTFNCAATGFPAPTLTITETSENSIADQGTGVVTLTSASLDDSGAMVNCSAMNNQGTDYRRFILYVGTRGAQPTNVMASINTPATMVSVTWDFDDGENNVPLSHFGYSVTATGTRMAAVSDSVGASERSVSIPLSSLEDDTQYDVTIVAENLLGTGMPGGAQFRTTMSGAPGNSMSMTSCLVSVLVMVSVTFLLRT